MRFIFFLLVFLFSEISYAAPPVKIIDGDSLFIGRREIRLWGIDAPEYHQNCYDKDGNIYPCGKRSLKTLKKLAAHGVSCEKKAKDRFGREVSECFAKEINVNEEMVKRGWAVAYDRYTKKFVSAEREAKKSKRGIWQGRFMKPELYRRLTK